MGARAAAMQVGSKGWVRQRLKARRDSAISKILLAIAIAMPALFGVFLFARLFATVRAFPRLPAVPFSLVSDVGVPLAAVRGAAPIAQPVQWADMSNMSWEERKQFVDLRVQLLDDETAWVMGFPLGRRERTLTVIVSANEPVEAAKERELAQQLLTAIASRDPNWVGSNASGVFPVMIEARVRSLFEEGNLKSIQRFSGRYREGGTGEMIAGEFASLATSTTPGTWEVRERYSDTTITLAWLRVPASLLLLVLCWVLLVRAVRASRHLGKDCTGCEGCGYPLRFADGEELSAGEKLGAGEKEAELQSSDGTLAVCSECGLDMNVRVRRWW